MTKYVITEVFLFLQYVPGFILSQRFICELGNIIQEQRETICPIPKGDIVVTDEIVYGSKIGADEFAGVHDSGTAVIHIFIWPSQRRTNQEIRINWIDNNIVPFS